MNSIDLNCDMGESYGKFIIGNDKKIMPYISSCNIACGFHGGDPLTIETTIKLAINNNVKIGAHPSYPDLSGFGRRVMDIASEELLSGLKYQISAVKGMTEAEGGKLHHVKPHGALYNAACKNEKIAQIIVDTLAAIDKKLLLYGPAGLSYHLLAEKAGIKYISEVFADRNYEDDLSLVSRAEPDAVIQKVEESIDHVERMLQQGVVKTRKGNIKDIAPETICIHGDQPGAADLAKKLNEHLKNIGFTIAAPKK